MIRGQGSGVGEGREKMLIKALKEKNSKQRGLEFPSAMPESSRTHPEKESSVEATARGMIEQTEPDAPHKDKK